jgi:lipoprotein-anchoring transpeptidase ErfK/SrfK
MRRWAALWGLFATGAAAQGMPPWISADVGALDPETKSVAVLRRNEPLFAAPGPNAARRGAAALGARLPFYGATRAAGCKGPYFLVGPEAWVCGDFVAPSSLPSDAPDAPASHTDDGLPLAYYFVGKDGSFGYANLRSAEETAPARQFDPGFSVAVSETANKSAGDPFGLTTKGLWLPLRDLNRARPLVFSGYDVTAGKFDQGFVVAEHAAVFDGPNGRRIARATEEQFAHVPVLETRETHGRRWVRIGEGRWLDGTSVRVPTLATPPPEARPGERFIDVDLTTQTLTLYQGDEPVFATLVSTGIGHGNEVTATPVGTHRVWVKLRTTDMTNLEDEDALRYYAIEEVPWVLFFDKGYGLHGAFWHRSFGHVRSHGCVNLTPLDAKRVFDWAGPRLPAGWTAALPTEYDQGTLVRVR